MSEAPLWPGYACRRIVNFESTPVRGHLVCRKTPIFLRQSNCSTLGRAVQATVQSDILVFAGYGMLDLLYEEWTFGRNRAGARPESESDSVHFDANLVGGENRIHPENARKGGWHGAQ